MGVRAWGSARVWVVLWSPRPVAPDNSRQWRSSGGGGGLEASPSASNRRKSRHPPEVQNGRCKCGAQAPARVAGHKGFPGVSALRASHAPLHSVRRGHWSRGRGWVVHLLMGLRSWCLSHPRRRAPVRCVWCRSLVLRGVRGVRRTGGGGGGRSWGTASLHGPCSPPLGAVGVVGGRGGGGQVVQCPWRVSWCGARRVLRAGGGSVVLPPPH